MYNILMYVIKMDNCKYFKFEEVSKYYLFNSFIYYDYNYFLLTFD